MQMNLQQAVEILDAGELPYSPANALKVRGSPQMHKTGWLQLRSLADPSRPERLRRALASEYAKQRRS